MIVNLLKSVIELAGREGIDLNIVRNPGTDPVPDDDQHPLIELAGSEEIESVNRHRVDVAGGTAWLWSREGMAGSIDILFVTPYNAQVGEISKRLPKLNVGTVDKFQGQQAPVVIVSYATSTPEEAPRGMDFLYSLNRLNVAVSRARCGVFLVCASALIEPECKKSGQMRLANGLARYIELAADRLNSI